jgi:hypothetical protein
MHHLATHAVDHPDKETRRFEDHLKNPTIPSRLALSAAQKQHADLALSPGVLLIEPGRRPLVRICTSSLSSRQLASIHQ